MARQLHYGKHVSERVIGIHVRVIVNADGFVTIATALPRFFARNARLAANVEFLGSGRDFVDCVGVCGVGFVGGRGVGGLRGLYGDVWGVPDACPAGGGEQRVQACGGAGPGGQKLNFVQVFCSSFYWGMPVGCPLFLCRQRLLRRG